MAAADASLTHSNKNAHACCVVWVRLLKALLLRQDKSHQLVLKELEQLVESRYKDTLVHQWVHTHEDLPFNRKIGFVAISFIHGFNLLR